MGTMGQATESWDRLLGAGTGYWELGQATESWDRLLRAGTGYWELGQAARRGGSRQAYQQSVSPKLRRSARNYLYG